MAALAIPAAFILGAFMAPGGSAVATVVATVLVSLPALALYCGARDGRRRDRLALLVTAVTGIGALGVLLGVAVATGKDPGATIAAKWAAAIPELIGTYRSSGWSESSLLTAGKVFDGIRLLLAWHLPGLVLAAATLYAAILVYPFGGLAGLHERDLGEPSFSRFSTPVAAAVLFVPAGLAAALGPAGWSQPAVDLLLPLAILFFLRGLAIIRSLLDKGRTGPLGRALVYTLVIQMPFPMILALGGLFDEFLNIRARLDRPAPDDRPPPVDF